MEIVDYGPLWETMRRNNVTQYQLLQSGIDTRRRMRYSITDGRKQRAQKGGALS